jgi:nucleoside-diphosphate-sugar epimerase
MSTILITGVSGFIGKALAEDLAGRHQVIGLSRKDPGLKLPWIRGDFGSFEDLRQLDRHPIDAVVHLAAVTGGCLERDGILVNVEGTRCLTHYLIDRGCKKFVLASSIAAVGLQSTAFRPRQLPMPDEHPCLDRDGYGLSKFLMEEVVKYLQRQNPHTDAIALRLAAICPDEPAAPPMKTGPLGQWASAALTMMVRSDAVRAFRLAVESPCQPGMRIMNAAGPRAWAADPVATILRGWWGADVDVSPFEKPGHEYDSVFDVNRIKKELGFVAQRTAR